MAYEDYSHEEIDNICNKLLAEHADKLKALEILFIEMQRKKNKHVQIFHEDRDTLLGIYDRIGEVNYQ